MPTEPRPAPKRAGLAVVGLFGLALAGIAGTTVALLPRGSRPPAVSVVGGPFRLESSKGGVLDSASLRGRPYLVFFGFTHCPNVCPTTLADLGTLLDEFARQGGDVRAYYITLDPERDTPALMREYMAAFSDRLTGLTGTPEAIAAVARAYRATARKVPLPGGDYTLEHTLMVYMVDRDGGFAGPLDLDAGHGLALKQLHRLAAAGRDS
ncbi:SCO family protein [uncultured Methylobacterium sp.]|jgi:protein SCO1/2|uniref:SCO family protein n=1 Tax=uncultured Methylobacterium sp. TaxID=157278 RepID=UPI0026313103|nr:SCO family protein [uncultured Methylobacterium sp.]